MNVERQFPLPHSPAQAETVAPRKQPIAVSGGPSSHDASQVHEKLFDLYDRMIGEVNLPAVLRELTDVVCRDLNAQRATVYLVNRETEELESVAVVGNVGRTIRVPIRPESLAGFCALTGQSFAVPDAYGDLGDIDSRLTFDRRWDGRTGFRTRDVLCAPAQFKERTVGVVQVMNSRGRPFGAADLPPLCNIARLVGYSLHHARLYDDLATMKRLEKEKAEFMRVLIHELKSPAAAAKMMTDLLAGFPTEHPKVSSLHARIAERMDEMIEMIQDILVLAKTKSGDPMGQIAVLELPALAAQCVEEHRESARSKGLALRFSAPEAPLLVRMDSQGCRLVLSNLISNAVKYTPAGWVEVSVRREDSWAVLAVRDSGIGVPAAEIPKLFREFFRASNARKTKIPGTGVGLAGVKSIVERFGGTLALESAEGEGSTFTVRLPIFEET
jgi:signal transduction histidine kinase